MGKIIKVASFWTEEELSEAAEEIDESFDEKCILIADSESEVFEYDELENVTINYSDIAEEIVEGEEEGFIDEKSLVVK